MLPNTPILSHYALSNLAKAYTENQKYAGAHHEFYLKLIKFKGLCQFCGVSEDQYALAFPIMLTGTAKQYFNFNVRDKYTDFRGMATAVRDNFETSE